jgi:hypothetical protein
LRSSKTFASLSELSVESPMNRTSRMRYASGSAVAGAEANIRHRRATAGFILED